MQMSLKAESLYFFTLEERWEEVVAEYERNARIHKRPINITNDTALHMAVNDNRADVVEKLVKELKRSKKSLSALELGNYKGDTPLHRAASRGSLEMCRCIAEAQGGGDNKLIEARNKSQETPLYLAALHGHKDAFLYLHSRCADKTVGPCRRGGDGDTVLHCTIRRDYFELAYEIIHMYKYQIVGSVDEKGTTPLHILATKTSGFESSSNFRWYNKLLYSCIMVEPFMIREQSSENKGEFLNNWLNSPKTQTGYRTRKEADTEDPGYDDGYEDVPPNYRTCNILMRALALLAFFIGLVFAAFGLEDIRKKKEKHVWCGRILEALWKHKNTAYVSGGSAPPILYASDDDDNEEEEDEEFSNNQEEEEEDDEEFSNPFDIHRHKPGDHGTNKERKPNVMGHQNTQEGDGENKEESEKRESAFFIAAKNGVMEILEKIMRDKPEAIHETNSQGQNLLQVAVENRQPSVIEAMHKNLKKEDYIWDDLVKSVDTDENTILHLAAKYEEFKTHPWQIQGTALQMQWEIKWYEYVKSLSSHHLLFLSNKQGQTPEQIFTKGHEKLVKDSSDWLKDTSESCSVVAALVAGVSFATSSQVPGGTNGDTGKPTLEHQPAFELFAITALIGLSFSVTAPIMFLSILTSRKLPRDFKRNLPLQILLGLSSLFVSIASMLVSFCAAHFFVLEDRFKKAVVFPLYAATCLPVSLYAIVQFPLYMDLLKSIITQDIEDLKKKKQKHVWCRQLLDEIWEYKEVAYVGGGSAFRGYSFLRTVKDLPKPDDHQIGAIQGGGENTTVRPNDGGNHSQQKGEENKTIKKVDVDHNKSKAKNGVLEILEKIMKDRPRAIHEINSQGQNVLQVAVMCRQPHVFKHFQRLLADKQHQRTWDDLLKNLDIEGNTILHLAAKLSQYKP
ncbi:hypothetical protein K1719_010071 [Acacia pycnantha]|nr:hypothetical protein K1719_010071 [Acacia pycnantha]